MRALGLWCVLVCLAGCAERALPFPKAKRVADLGAAGDLSAPVDLSTADAPVDLGPACEGLDEATCRTRPDCVANRCFDCRCAAAYLGCRSLGGPPASCPALGCSVTCCSSAGDCDDPLALECVPPGESPGCGICFMGRTCQRDADCAAADGGVYPYDGPVCDSPGNYGLCPTCFGGLTCLPGCVSDGECRAGQVCTSTHHCVDKPCSGAADCPANFDCGGGRCVRRSCKSDLDCPQGFCVNGACWDGGLGTCQPIPV